MENSYVATKVGEGTWRLKTGGCPLSQSKTATAYANYQCAVCNAVIL